MIRIGVGRVSAARAIHRQKHRRQQAALVIGGGVSGMTAALAIADSGFQVHLVERTDALGGNLRNLYYVAEGYNPQRLLRDLVNRVRAHQRITTYLRSEVADHSGHVGDFRAIINTQYADGASDEIAIQYGAAIVATGAEEKADHPWLALPQVITQQKLEEKILHHPKEIAALNHVVMIQCVAAAGKKFYCSRVCCTNTMKNATRLRLFNPGCRVTVLYKDIVTYGFREAFYTEARQSGVLFVRYTDEQPPEIVVEPDGVKVRVRDLALNRWLLLPADLIPLSMTVAPRDGTEELARTLRVPLASEGFFNEAQLKLRPMDFARDGIFLAGMAHYPKFIEESISHALAAAGRALTLLAQESMHLGGVVAIVDPDKCVGCLTCTRVCPFSIPQVVNQPGRNGVGGLGGAAYIDPSQCHGCGTCTADCPADAIELANYRSDQMFLREIHGLGRWMA